MFDSVRRHQRILLGLILLLIIPSFVVVGAWDLIAPGSDANTVASVGRQKIQKFEWERSHQQRLDQIRQQLGGRIDPSLFDSPGSRLSTLNDLVTQQVLLQTADALRVRISDDQIRKTIASIPAVQKDGKFDMGLYQQALKAQGLTPEGFEQRIRADLALEAAPAAIAASEIVPRSVARRLAQTALESRGIRVRKFAASDVASGIQITEAEISDFYKNNTKNFETAEEVDIALVAFPKPASADQVEQFSNMVYEQSDTLEPASKKFGLPIQTVKSIRRDGVGEKLSPELLRVVGHPKMLAALFSADVIANKRNTEAVEIAPGMLASARVVAHRPAQAIALEKVKPAIEKQLRERKALDKVSSLAQAAAKDFSPAASASLGTLKTVSRQDLQKQNAVAELPAAVLSAVFSAELGALPMAISVPAASATQAAWMVVIESAQVPAADSAQVKELLAREVQRLEQSARQDMLDRWITLHRDAIGVKTFPEKLAKSDSR
ncbi:MAG: hypothetical protein FGM18_03900 [Burkholderiaceae bacterium]|nr:hypothetical protein [Burkholderiaceae bacterium]